MKLDSNILVSAAMLGFLIKLYDDIIDMNNSLRENIIYMFFLKTWIVLLTVTVFDSIFVFCPFAILIMICSYIFGCLDDLFWYELGTCIFAYMIIHFQGRYKEMNWTDLWFITAAIVSILYEEILFPEEISCNKVKCRLNGAVLMAFLNLFIYFSGIDQCMDIRFLTTFIIFGQSYCLMSVINHLMEFSLANNTRKIDSSGRTTKPEINQTGKRKSVHDVNIAW